MRDDPSLPLGHIDGAEVAVQRTLNGQDILIEPTDAGLRLAQLLTTGTPETVPQGEPGHYRIPHTRQVDHLLVELTDLFISIRYAHPTLIQLELELEPAEP